MVVEAPCDLHEEQIQENTKEIAELKTEIRFKEKRIDEVYVKIDKMEDKIDKLNENVNQLLLQSTQGDTDLELRLKAIETQQEVLKEADDKNRADFNTRLVIVTVILGILTFYFNFVR